MQLRKDIFSRLESMKPGKLNNATINEGLERRY